MKYIELESDRLTFRKFRPDDFPVVFDWLSNLENMKYRSSEPKNEREAREALSPEELEVFRIWLDRIYRKLL